MSDEPEITVDDLLKQPPTGSAWMVARYVDEVIRRDNEAFEAKARERFVFVAQGIAGLRASRRRWDLRRIGDRYVECRCRGLVDLSDAAAQVRSERPTKIVYRTTDER